MKSKLLHTIIFILTTPLTISTTLLLFITFISTTTFNDKDINQKDDFMRNMSSEQFREQQRINLIETDFNANMEIFKINEEIYEAEILIEEVRNRQITYIKEQNSN